MREICPGVPLPLFCIGDRVAASGVGPEPDIGRIIGMFYSSLPTDDFGDRGWSYRIQFTSPRSMIDDVHESYLTLLD